jgi:hypothetical protein
MKKIILTALSGLTLVVFLNGCGLVSGTAFVSQGVDGEINAVDAPQGVRGGRSLDDGLAGVVVDLTDNSDYGDIDVQGIEAGCIRTHAINHLATPVSGEVWITLDTTLVTDDPAVVMANGFRVFSGIALLASETRDFTCEETLALLENVDQLVNAVQIGYFKAWGIGNEDTYDFSLENIYIGLYLTGSL